MKSVLFHSILLAYLLASLIFWRSLGLRRDWLFQVAHGLLWSGLGVQTRHRGYRLLQSPGFRGDVYASMGLLSWAISVGYLVAWWRYRIDALGSFVVPLAFLAAAYSGVPTATTEALPLAFQHLWLVVHIFLAVLGYAALTLTFCAGV